MASTGVSLMNIFSIKFIIKLNYGQISEMSQYIKRNNKGGYYNVGKRYLAETYANIFKVAIEYKKVVGVFLPPTHFPK